MRRRRLPSGSRRSSIDTTRRRQRRTRRPRQGLQRLRLQYLRQRFHLSGNAVETGRLQNGARPGAGTLHLPGLLRRRVAFPGRGPALRLSPARQRDRGQRRADCARPRPGQTHALQWNSAGGHAVGRPGYLGALLHRVRDHRRTLGKADTTMNMVLRPGEAIVWRWGQWNPVKYHTALYTMPTYTDTIYNGLWEYRPDLSSRRGGRERPRWRTSGRGADGLMAEDGKTGSIVWTMNSPYVFVGGRIEAEGNECTVLPVSGWKDAGRKCRQQPGQFLLDRGTAMLRVPGEVRTAGAGASLKKLAIINDLQMAPLALPEMAVGENASPTATRRRVRGRSGSRTSGSSVPRPEPPAAPRRSTPRTAASRTGRTSCSSGRFPRIPTGTASAITSSSCRGGRTCGSPCR